MVNLNLKSLFGLIFFQLVSFAVFAQTGNIKNYTVNDGLASSTVYKIIQDKKGYMWFATENGVQRYDGKNLETFTIENGLMENSIMNLYEDSKGRIWFLGLSGTLSYFHNGQIYTSKNEPSLKNSSGSSYLTDISEIGSDSLFYIAYSDTCGYLWTVNGVERIPFKDVIFKVNPFSVSRMADGKVLVGYQLGLFEFDSKSKTLIRSPSKALDNIISKWSRGSGFYRNFLSKKHFLHITANLIDSTIYIHETSTDTLFAAIKLNITELFQLRLDESNNLFISTNDGVYIYHVDTESKTVTQTQHLFRGIQIFSVLIDKDGNQWYSSNQNGIYLIATENEIKTVNPAILKKGKINDLQYDNRNKLWLGYESGYLVLFDMNLLNIIYEKKGSKISTLYKSGEKIYVNTAGFYSIDQNLQLRSFSTMHSKSSASFKDFFLNGSALTMALIDKNDLAQYSFTSPRIYKIFRTSNGTVYLCSSSGLFSLHESYVKELYTGLKGDRIFPNLHIERNKLEIYNGLSYPKIHVHQSLEEIFGKHLKQWFTASAVDVVSDKKGVEWVTTLGGGIYCIKNDSIIRRITVSDGLSSNTGSQILIQNDSTIWVGTNKGLNLIEIRDQKTNIEVFDITNGLPANDVSALEQTGDTVWVGTTNGLAYFNTKKIHQNKKALPVYVHSFYVNNKFVPFSPIMNLEYNQNLIQFNFVGISFKNSERVNYRYKLLGLQSDWQFTKSNTVQYDFLPPGDYKFVLNARLGNGDWYAPTDTMMFKITPAYFQTGWFYLSILTVVTGFVVALFRYRVHQITIREQIKAESAGQIIESELKALRLQMNPHFMFNSLNGIQYFFTNNESEKATKYLSKFAKLMRMILENSRKNTVALSEEINALNLYLELEEIRFNSKFTYEIIIDPDLDIQSVEILPMIIQPFVENSILHGVTTKPDKGKITISFTGKGRNLIIEIDDDGIGRVEAEKRKSLKSGNHQSVGLQVTKERLDYLNILNQSKSRIEIIDKFDPKTQQSSGTKVVITFPDSIEDSE